MPKCTVLFDDFLPPAELKLLLNAISLFRGVKGVTLENDVEVTSGQSSHLLQNQTQALNENDSDVILDPDTQRYFIDEVIKWAVKNNQLHLEDVRRWSPEEIISQAVAIFESMTEQQKSTVGLNVSKHAERVIVKTKN
jgi:hypothetical protein